MRILEQALEQIPAGPVMHRRPAHRAAAQERDLQHDRGDDRATSSIIMDGIQVPPGEVYSFTEGGNGELGFYIVSDGTGRPWKCRVRPPCFVNLRSLRKLHARPVHRRHRPDLRHDQHDRRGVRPADDRAHDTADPGRQRRRRAAPARRDGHRHHRRRAVTSSRRAPTCSRPCNAVGADVPFFCYHPGLSSPAVLPAVPGRRQGAAQAGAVLLHAGRPTRWRCTPTAARARRAREQMLEFTLLNHPIDCPICDKAGECTLQKHYFDWDAKYARNDGIKVHKAKVVDLGPTHRARPGALHPVHALHPRLRRGRQARTSSRWPSAATTRC